MAGELLVLALGLFGVLLVHELGHLVVARWYGVRVLSISVGFGPELIGLTDRTGTRWSFAAIPVGGSCRFASRPEEETPAMLEAQRREKYYSDESIAKRMAVCAAGPFGNIALACSIYLYIWLYSGFPRS